jgi:hypothetical protein
MISASILMCKDNNLSPNLAVILFGVLPPLLLPFPPFLILFFAESFCFLFLSLLGPYIHYLQVLIADTAAEDKEEKDGRQNEADYPAHGGNATCQAIEEHTGENGSKRIGKERPQGKFSPSDPSDQPQQVHKGNDNQAAPGSPDTDV